MTDGTVKKVVLSEDKNTSVQVHTDVTTPNESEDDNNNNVDVDSNDGSLPLYVSNPGEWFNSLVKQHQYVCIVLFRGHWCQHDKHFLTTMLGQFHIDNMSDDDVHLVAWTSEGMDGARRANEEWELATKYKYAQVIGDDSCALANWLRDEGAILNSLVITPLEEAEERSMLIETKCYKNGIVHPGIVFYAHHGTLVLYWEAKVENLQERPLPSEMWRKVQKRKHALDLGNATVPVNGANLKMSSVHSHRDCTLV